MNRSHALYIWQLLRDAILDGYFTQHTGNRTYNIRKLKKYRITNHLPLIWRATKICTRCYMDSSVSPCFFLTVKQSQISSVRVLPSGCSMFIIDSMIKCFFSRSSYLAVRTLCCVLYPKLSSLFLLIAYFTVNTVYRKNTIYKLMWWLYKVRYDTVYYCNAVGYSSSDVTSGAL